MIFSTTSRLVSRITLRLFALLTLLIGSTIASGQPELFAVENSRSMQWLNNIQGLQSSSSDSALLNVLLSIHYRPSYPLISLYEAEYTETQNRLILSSFIYQCTNYPEISYCEDALLESRLLELDSDNFVPYLHLFNHYLAQGDVDSALAILKAGLKTEETNDYYFEKVMYLRDELSSSIEFVGSRANLAAEIYSLNGLVQTYISIIPICVEQATISQEWRDVCLELSLRLEQGITFFSNVYGAAIRRDVVSATSSDEIEIQAAVRHRRYYDEFRISARLNLSWWDDPAGRPNSFYGNAAVFGELRAIEMEIEQAKKDRNE
ncbi:MAG: hypothetical protein COA96_11265 [SAR86 cluster bacterium]|uniref:Tetratricopeptide repeat protein n=1 Tax=SAR86 cluster bacterium TaxID=2030880 RepID=A0A2A5AWR0_9GAMM|nr:MAG: hypothetical protein COA96_11265 [SAR86 cluster bacterium]